MRNLKKTLCLILALVFVLGLCTVGAAGVEFSDASQIKYANAVKAMAGLGILKGDDNDGDGKMEFRPKDGLTRAEAAKIISYVVAGPNIEQWPARQVFDDVPSTHWAAKYVAYCYHNNIINGVGDGKFAPNEKVTLVAVAKMLLASCGYGAKGEFTGSDWIFNVSSTAMQTKILQGLVNVNLEAQATREETALLAYNTLLNVIQVTLSSDTNSYVPVSVNGVSSVTLSETTWDLRTDEGVVIANKTNDSTAKGTILGGSGRLSYYVTEEDENPDILGHYVSITYRIESEGRNTVALAYFIDDACTEVKGPEAVNAAAADTVYCFSSGKLVNNPVPGKTARANSPGIYVLNQYGEIVAYKIEGYFVSVLSINYLNGQATVVEPSTGISVPVLAPAGAKAGDIVTVTHMGDIYTAHPTTRTAGVLITQSAQDTVNNVYTYNYGAIYPSRADMLSITNLPTITKLDGTNQLQLGYSYTLYFDSEGGCIGFADQSGSGGAVLASADYVMLIDTFKGTDFYGSETYYAQVIRGDGSNENLSISKDTYNSGLINTLYRVKKNGSVYDLYTVDTSEAAYEKYSTADPITDFSQATYIWYSGSRGSLQVKTTLKPQVGSYVFYTYKIVKDGTVNIRRVQSVWFETASSSVVPISNSYIFVAGTKPTSSRLVNGVVVDLYDGYMNGNKMEDLATSSAPTKEGFATYSKSAAGVYTLKYVADGDGTGTGVRTVTLVDGNTSSAFILNGKLYIADALGNKQGMDLAGVKVIKVGTAAADTLKIDSVATLQSAVLAGKKVTITLVEAVSTSAHSIGGAAIYVIAID